MKTTLTIEYLRDGHWHVGQLREVPGVFSQRRNLAELHEKLRDAYWLVLKDQRPVRRKGGFAGAPSRLPCESPKFSTEALRDRRPDENPSRSAPRCHSGVLPLRRPMIPAAGTGP